MILIFNFSKINLISSAFFSLLLVFHQNTHALEITSDSLNSRLVNLSKNPNLNIILETPGDLHPVKNSEPLQIVGPNSVPNDFPNRTVRIELAPVPTARAYEIEIAPPFNDKSFKPYFFHLKQSNPSLRIKMIPGEYKIRTRSLVNDIDAGSWSEFANFWILFKTPGPIYPAPDSEIEARSENTHELFFDWQDSPFAQAYYFKLKDSQNNILQSACLHETWIKSPALRANQDYQWSITPVNSNQECELAELNDPIIAYYKFRIIPKILDKSNRLAEVFVNPDSDAIKYQFELSKIDDNGKPLPAKLYIAHEPQLKLRLEEGEYQMRVQTVYLDDSLSKWSPREKFFVKLRNPELIYPINSKVLQSKDDLVNNVTLKWNQVPGAKVYGVFVYDENGILVKQGHVKQNGTKVKLAHKKNYQWQVKAYASERESQLQEPPPPPKKEDPQGKFAISEYVKLNLSPAEETSQYYAWARYIVSMVNYTGRNYDYNSVVSQSLFGGEGELAVGQWNRVTGLGWLGHLSLAGFSFRNTYYTYANGGVHYGIRKILQNDARFRLWLGINYQELPEVLTQPFTNVVNYEHIASAGPQIQAAYLNAFNNTWGWALGASYYKGTMGLKTPNDLQQNANSSFRAGAYFTYIPPKKSLIFFQDYKWLMGYTYKADNASYGTNDPFGTENTTSVTGHYLSAALEFSLDPALK